jgi:hypothetical protein
MLPSFVHQFGLLFFGEPQLDGLIESPFPIQDLPVRPYDYYRASLHRHGKQAYAVSHMDAL